MWKKWFKGHESFLRLSSEGRDRCKKKWKEHRSRNRREDAAAGLQKNVVF